MKACLPLSPPRPVTFCSPFWFGVGNGAGVQAAGCKSGSLLQTLLALDGETPVKNIHPAHTHKTSSNPKEYLLHKCIFFPSKRQQ